MARTDILHLLTTALLATTAAAQAPLDPIQLAMSLSAAAVDWLGSVCA